jgi:hypothetical protein
MGPGNRAKGQDENEEGDPFHGSSSSIVTSYFERSRS